MSDMVERVVWRVQRINCEPKPFALIDSEGPFGDVMLAWDISEEFAPVLAKLLNVRLLGRPTVVSGSASSPPSA